MISDLVASKSLTARAIQHADMWREEAIILRATVDEQERELTMLRELLANQLYREQSLFTGKDRRVGERACA